ncbi:MAG TPA: hypothetical protein PK185_06895 [Cyclobacteriaceae bacterium]|nr:hypothetical protein [Cyclobacteriaceae bacterium]
MVGVLLIYLCSNSFGQSNNTLSAQLWERVNDCYSMFEDMNDDGIVDGEITDDSKNGFLQISGSWPTCGCDCTNIVGAYRGKDGTYTFLEQETWGCSWIKRISSNRNLDEVFPDDLAKAFASEFDEKTVMACFFLSVDIPRIGTDTKLVLGVIPFGMSIQSNSIISFEYTEKESYSNCKSLYEIKSIARKIQNTETLDYIVNNKFNEISKHDIAIVNEAIGDDDSRFKSKDELVKSIQDIKRTYELYMLIEHESLTLGWNRDRSKFYIKERGAKPKVMTFMEFLMANRFWSPAC